MKKLLLLLLSLALLVVVGISLVRMSPLLLGATHTPAATHFDATERYVGTIDGVQYIFEDSNFTHYRMSVGAIVTEGELNTERGFTTDPDATLYILDWRKPESEQTLFVRTTAASNQLQMLDSTRNIIPGALLKRE